MNETTTQSASGIVYAGGCHCDSVRFEVTLEREISRLLECNCSICTKKGILHVPALVTQFRVTKGDEALSLYQFRTNTARHWFCSSCGIHTFGRPRNNPERYTVNARCLDDFLAIKDVAEIVYFDGLNHPKDAQA